MTATVPGDRAAFHQQLHHLKARIKQWALELGFAAAGISDARLPRAEAQLQEWLRRGFHGEMRFMARHGAKRTRPDALVPGTRRVITVAMHYYPEPAAAAHAVLQTPDRAYVSRYALGRDYHKLMRKRLQKLADRITATVRHHHYRAFVDSAPVMEKPLAEQAGLGWIGKHTNLIDRRAGSWFFLGELYTDLPLPPDAPAQNHCGSCRACIDICPTRAIVAPFQLDARRCIAYLTIELRGTIPEPLRPLLGNRIYGCDDCQLICPWNRFARLTQEQDFLPRHGLDNASLIHLFAWSEQDFEERLRGSPIRRIGHECWLRNIAVALGNAPPSSAVLAALQSRRHHPSSLVREHVAWAITQQENKRRRQ